MRASPKEGTILYVEKKAGSIMAFGSTLEQKKPVRNSNGSQGIFLDLKEGARDVRILGSEVQVKVIWKDKKPIRIARLVEGTWRGFQDENWYDCPMNAWVNSHDEAEQKKLYAKTRFLVNVYDRTPVVTVDGVTYYPNKAGKYFKKTDKGFEELRTEVDAKNPNATIYTPEPHNKVMVIDQSGGAEGGKHFLQSLMTAAENLMSMKTNKHISINESDLRIVTKGEGIDTNRSVFAGFNQEPLTVTEMYDLESFAVVWPYEAQNALLNGADYSTVIAGWNIPMFPELKPV